jgi:Zn-dependent protease with chaperone function
MGLPKIEKYAETEILKGRTHQEVFNEIVSSSEYKIHDIAEILRKITSPKKRERYKTTNYVLAGILAIMAVLNLFSCLTDSTRTGILSLLPIICNLIMLWGVLKFWKNIYRVCLVFLWVHTVSIMFLLIFNFNWILLPILFFLIDSIVIAFYLNIKTSADYRLNRELLNNDPAQRADSIVFID